MANPTETVTARGRVPEAFLREAVRKIVEALHPHKIILFGSLACGKAR